MSGRKIFCTLNWCLLHENLELSSQKEVKAQKIWSIPDSIQSYTDSFSHLLHNGQELHRTRYLATAAAETQDIFPVYEF